MKVAKGYYADGEDAYEMIKFFKPSPEESHMKAVVEPIVTSYPGAAYPLINYDHVKKAPPAPAPAPATSSTTEGKEEPQHQAKAKAEGPAEAKTEHKHEAATDVHAETPAPNAAQEDKEGKEAKKKKKKHKKKK
jgi:hypothetical protein